MSAPWTFECDKQMTDRFQNMHHSPDLDLVMTSPKNSRYILPIVGQENASALLTRSCRWASVARHARLICSASDSGSSVSRRNSVSPTSHLDRGESCATTGIPQAIASTKTLPKDSSFARCQNTS